MDNELIRIMLALSKKPQSPHSGQKPQQNEQYLWDNSRKGYCLYLRADLKTAVLTISSLPKGTSVEPLGIEQKIRGSWSGVPEKTEIDTALDIETFEDFFSVIFIARFLNGDFKYGAEYRSSRVNYSRPRQDFTDVAKFIASVQRYFGISYEQFQALFTNSNLPETHRNAIRALIG